MIVKSLQGKDAGEWPQRKTLTEERGDELKRKQERSADKVSGV